MAGFFGMEILLYFRIYMRGGREQFVVSLKVLVWLLSTYDINSIFNNKSKSYSIPSSNSLHLQSVQYVSSTSGKQQSPPSKSHSLLLFPSSHIPSPLKFMLEQPVVQGKELH